MCLYKSGTLLYRCTFLLIVPPPFMYILYKCVTLRLKIKWCHLSRFEAYLNVQLFYIYKCAVPLDVPPGTLPLSYATVQKHIILLFTLNKYINSAFRFRFGCINGKIINGPYKRSNLAR